MRVGLIWLGWLMWSGCAFVDGGPSSEMETPEVVVATDAEVYTLSQADSIAIQISNASSEVIYFDTCGAVLVEELAAEEVRNTWQLTFNRCYHITDLAPGHEQSFSFGMDLIRSRLEGATLNDTVRYRFLLPAFHRDEAQTTPLPDETRRSNAFLLQP